MVKLRLRRFGRKQAPFYRIVAADSRVNRDGEYIELVGTYNPQSGETKIDSDLALKWLQNGAQPTDTVRDLFSRRGIMKLYHEAKTATQTQKNPSKSTKVAKPKPAAKVASKKSTATTKEIK